MSTNPTDPDPLPTRKTLIREAQAGNDGAWAELYAKYRPLIEKWAKGINGRLSQADIEDLTQQVFKDVADQHKPKWDSARGSKFRGWLKEIVRHKLTDMLRQQERRRCEHGTQLLEQERASGGLTELHEREWKEHVVRQALAVLEKETRPDRYRVFIKLVMEEAKPTEVACEFKLQRGTVDKIKHDCLKRLRDIVAVCRGAETSSAAVQSRLAGQ